MSAGQDTSFARLVSLACHDLRTPLATVSGFARTIQQREELADPLPRYLDMIVAASEQMRELLETLAVAVRIEGDRYDPAVAEVDTLAAARTAAERVDGVRAEGEGETVETDVETLTRSLSALASCARRHGGVPEVTLAVNGREIAIGPIGDAGAVILGEELRDLGAAVAVKALRALGGTVELDGETLRLTL